MDTQLPTNRIQKISCIGSGNYGQVWKCQVGSDLYALKIIKLRNNTHNIYIKRELKYCHYFRNENIVRSYSFSHPDSITFQILMELCDWTLRQQISRSKDGLKQEQAINYLKQLVNGYWQLYKVHAIHRDLKPQNILIKDKKVKLADFGVAKEAKKESPETQTNQQIGTQPYMPPQAFKNKKKYSYKFDVWSIGMLFYEMLHNERIWDCSNAHLIVQNAKQFQSNKNGFVWKKKISKNAKDFIERCLEFNQEKRMSFAELMNHPIFQNCFKSKQNTLEILNLLRQKMKKENQLQASIRNLIANRRDLSLNQFKILLKTTQLSLVIEELCIEIIFRQYKTIDKDREFIPWDSLKHIFQIEV